MTTEGLYDIRLLEGKTHVMHPQRCCGKCMAAMYTMCTMKISYVNHVIVSTVPRVLLPSGAPPSAAQAVIQLLIARRTMTRLRVSMARSAAVSLSRRCRAASAAASVPALRSSGSSASPAQTSGWARAAPSQAVPTPAQGATSARTTTTSSPSTSSTTDPRRRRPYGSRPEARAGTSSPRLVLRGPARAAAMRVSSGSQTKASASQRQGPCRRPWPTWSGERDSAHGETGRACMSTTNEDPVQDDHGLCGVFICLRILCVAVLP
jgi:hypothetical protein